MAENNSHGESLEKRLKRFQNGPPTESISTLLNSIANFFNNEIRITPTHYQTCLLFLGIHGAILTISETIFNKRGLDGYKYFLENFVDGEAEDLKFSLIAQKIHDWRNILAHQWLGVAGHTIIYDYKMVEGWKKINNAVIINPGVYCKQYIAAFSSESKLWNFENYLGQDELEAAKNRIIKRYIKR